LALSGRVPGVPRHVVAFMPWPSAGGDGPEQACVTACDQLGGSASGGAESMTMSSKRLRRAR
jgi:hypothetical protein